MTVDAAAPATVPDERPRLVFFYSERSGLSRRVEGFLAQVLQRRSNHDTFRLHRVNVDERPDLQRRFKITAVPALAVINARKVEARLESPRGCAEINEFLRPWLR